MGPISLVVPLFSDSRTYVNRLPLQRRQWISLKNQTDMNFEIIGVDNSSHDDVIGLLKEYFPQAVTFRHPIPKNTVGARVEAVKRASHSFVVTLDSECVVWPHYIESWKKFSILCPGIVGVGGLSWYNGVILSGREYILGSPPDERIDLYGFEEFVRKTGISSRPCYPAAKSISDEDLGSIRPEPYSWSGGFYYSNAGFPKEVYIKVASPDSDLIGYGHDDSLFGLRLKAWSKCLRTTVKFVHAARAVHQCHRASHEVDASGPEDIKTAYEHAVRVKKLAEELLKNP